MEKLTLAAVALVVSFSTAIRASAQQGNMLEGNVDCGLWVTARTASRAVALEHYLMGLLNGMVLGSAIDFWRAGGVKISREKVYLWMDNYCGTHPLSDPVTGAIDLVNERTGNAWDRYWSTRQ